MSIEEFKTPFEIRLDKNNRWVNLGESIPSDDSISDGSWSSCTKQRG